MKIVCCRLGWKWLNHRRGISLRNVCLFQKCFMVTVDLYFSTLYDSIQCGCDRQCTVQLWCLITIKSLSSYSIRCYVIGVCSLSEMDKTTFYSRKASSLYLQNNLKTILFYIAYSFFFLNSFTASEMSCGKKTVKHFRKQYLTLFGLIPTFQHTPMEVLNTIQQHGIYSNVLVHAALFSQHVWTGKQHEYKKIMCTEMSFKGQVKATSVMNSTQTKVCMLKSIVIFFFFDA